MFEDVVQPMLVRRWGLCHSEGKLKGQLLAASLAALVKGSKSNAAIVAGKLKERELTNALH